MPPGKVPQHCHNWHPPKLPLKNSEATSEDPIGEAQQLLNKLGFNIGEPDGRMGVRTTNAIRLFQLQYGLKVTGEVTADLISQLQAKNRLKPALADALAGEFVDGPLAEHPHMEIPFHVKRPERRG